VSWRNPRAQSLAANVEAERGFAIRVELHRRACFSKRTVEFVSVVKPQFADREGLPSSRPGAAPR